MTLSDASSLMGGEAPVDGATAAHNMQKNHGPDPNYPEFALVITGHSLVHALAPSLELLFLGVAEHCNCKFHFFILKLFFKPEVRFLFFPF